MDFDEVVKYSNLCEQNRKYAGVKFEHISAPQATDIATSVAHEISAAILEVFDIVIPAFQSAAEQLIKTYGLSVVDLLSKTLAKAFVCTDNFLNFHFIRSYFIDLTFETLWVDAGYTKIKSRSLLNSMEKLCYHTTRRWKTSLFIIVSTPTALCTSAPNCGSSKSYSRWEGCSV
ncbi:hypothetical protein MKW92_017966 [Papaver armeniacum]|nr:hypothetical protein MKW92_017966 [Papaver armeniacum]